MQNFRLKTTLMALLTASIMVGTTWAEERPLSPAASMLLGQGNTADEPATQDTEQTLPDDYEVLPTGDLIIGEKGGNLHFITANGRYVFSGRMIDVWEQKEIRSADDLRATMGKINLKKMGFTPDQLNAFVIGAGNTQEVNIFVDPLCEFCNGLIKEATQIVASTSKYQFNFIVVPALGDESHRLSKAFYCSNEPLDKKVDALLNNSVDRLSQPSACDTTKYDLTLYAASAVGVSGVPFLINQDGVPTAGTPANFMAWLEGKK